VTNYTETGLTELQLGVDVDLVRNLSEGFSYEQDVAFLKSSLKIYFPGVLDEQSNFRFIVSRFQIDVAGHQILTCLVTVAIAAELAIILAVNN
jgi:hypothetical protein